MGDYHEGARIVPGKDRWPSGAEKTRVVFTLIEDAAETGEDTHVFETSGWIEDENALRSALARAIKLEGIAESWDDIGRMSYEAVWLWHRTDEGLHTTKAYVIPL